MNLLVVAIAVAALGLAIGVGLMRAVRRSAKSTEESVRKQRIIQGCALVVVAAILIFEAFHSPSHRWFNVALLGVMAAGVTFDVVRVRLSRRPPAH